MLHRFTLVCLASLLVTTGCREDAQPQLGGGGEGGSATGGAPGDGGSGGEGATGGGDVGGGSVVDADVTVMTWNLEDFPKSGNTVEGVSAVLDVYQPDVVALQEMPDSLPAFDSFDDALAEYRGILAQAGDGFSRVGLLYDPDRVTVSDAQMMFVDDDWAFPRPMLLAHITSKSDPSKDFYLGIVHLKAQLDEESNERRRIACNALEEWTRTAIENEIESEIVIVGDFNDQLTDPPEWNVFGPMLEAEGAKFLTLAPEEDGEFSYIPFESFIDHVFVRGDALLDESTAEVLHLDESVARYEDDVSDHRPVLAALRFD